MFVKQELPELPYAYDALEPVISKEIMELHHKKHHNGYVTNFNKLVDDATEAIMENNVPRLIALMKGLKFNGGGHVNHSLFWENLTPESSPPTGELAATIDKEFGSLEKFIEKFNAKTGPLQGSGWGWLGYCKEQDRLMIATCDNQDPLSTKGLVPLLGIDVWEHAYYLQYKNARPDYLKAIWKVINWTVVAQRFADAKK